VGFFLRVDDFGEAHRRMSAAWVQFVAPPRAEPYGRVAVFLDIAGNKWAARPLTGGNYGSSLLALSRRVAAVANCWAAARCSECAGSRPGS
jgi:hypothetical protein